MHSQRKPRRNPDKYAAILRAATKVFARNGFFNSKVADVAREANVADGTVYLYFKNKDDILISLFNQTMDEAIAAGRQALAAISDPIAKLRQVAYLHLDRLGRDRDLAVVFQVELRQSTKFMEQFSTTRVAEYLGIIRSILQDGQHAGVFRDLPDTNLAAKIFFGALDEMATNWILSRRKYRLVSTVEPVVELFCRGLCADRAVKTTQSMSPCRSRRETSIALNLARM